jgi:hypothetical protein
MITACDPTPEAVAKARRRARALAWFYLLLGVAGVGLGALAVTRARRTWEDDVLLLTGVMWLGGSYVHFKRSQA